MLPIEMTALVLGHRSWLQILWNGIRGKGISHGLCVGKVPLPTIKSTELLVKVHSVACNHTDVIHTDYVGPAHSIIGCEVSGTVEEVGESAMGDFKVGDRIAGVAATYGILAVTAMQGLYTKLDVPWPTRGENGFSKLKLAGAPTILIYAGSTTAGLFTIQLANLSGCTVVTTCSPHNFDLVKSLGADDVCDYHSPSALNNIKRKYPQITQAFNGISISESTKFCASVVEKSGGKVIVLVDTSRAEKRYGVEIIYILMYTLLGQPFAFLKPVGPASKTVPSDREALAKFYAMLPELSKSLKPPPVKVVPGDSDGILEAMDLLRNKNLSLI